MSSAASAASEMSDSKIRYLVGRFSVLGWGFGFFLLGLSVFVMVIFEMSQSPPASDHPLKGKLEFYHRFITSSLEITVHYQTICVTFI